MCQPKLISETQAVASAIDPIDEGLSDNLKTPSSKLPAFCLPTIIHETETVALDPSNEPLDEGSSENLEFSTDESDDENSDAKFTRVMACQWGKNKGPKLPQVFKLKSPQPGEPPFMKLR